MASLLCILLGALLATQIPALGMVFHALGLVFVGLGLVIGTCVLLLTLSAGVEGAGREARAMWSPLVACLPRYLRGNPGPWLMAAGFLGFMVLNVSLHLLMGR
jgi:hypothetical protein